MGRRRSESGGASRRWRIGLLGGGAAAVVAVLAVVLLVVVGGSEEPPPQPPAAGPDTGRTAAPEATTAPESGSGLPWPSGANANPPQDIRTWEEWIGRPTDVAVVFTSRSNWETITRDDWPMSGFRSYPGMLSVAQPLFPRDGDEAACARGEYDQHWAAFGQTLVRNSRPDAIVRPGWEFNGEWMPWNPRDTEVWKQCFRRVVTAIRSTSPEVRIDWNMTAHRDRMPNGDDVWNAYPGDDVVDIVSIDAYDSAPASLDQETFDDQCNRPSGACTVATFARKHGKQFAVPEWGMDRRNVGSRGGGGGDNPFYVEKMHELFAANRDILAYEAYYSAGTVEAENVQSALTPDLNPRAAQRYLELFGRPATASPTPTPTPTPQG